MMRPKTHPHWIPMLAMAAAGLFTLGCEGSGPEFLTGDTRIVEGTLESDEDIDTDFFALTTAGTVAIVATTIVGTNPETGGPIVAPLLGVGIGAPNPEDETQCQATFSQILSEGDSFSVFFQDGLYCVTMFRNPGSIEGGIFDYVITMTGAFS